MDIDSETACRLLAFFKDVDDGLYDGGIDPLVRPVRGSSKGLTLVKEVTLFENHRFVDSRLVWVRCARHLDVSDTVFAHLNRGALTVEGVSSVTFFQNLLSPKSLEDML